MIKWILLSLFTFNLFAQTSDNEAIIKAKKYDRVPIKLCKEQTLGCVPSVRIDSKNINLDVSSLDPNYLKGLQGMKDKGVRMGMTLKSYGIIVQESGHMPNPMVEQSIFKYVYKNNASLKICNFDESTQAIGCADSIVIKSDLEDVDARADYSKVDINKDDYLNKKAFVIGYFTIEKGHMPNPMVSQHVFKVVKVSFSSDTETVISDNSKRETNLKKLFDTESSQKKKPTISNRVEQR